MIKILGNFLTIGTDRHIEPLQEKSHTGLRFRNENIVWYFGFSLFKRIKE